MVLLQVLLQILDDGRVTDTQGHTVSFKNTVIIMTSNLGSAEIFEQLTKPDEAATREAAEAGKGGVMVVGQASVRFRLASGAISLSLSLSLFHSLPNTKVRWL